MTGCRRWLSIAIVWALCWTASGTAEEPVEVHRPILEIDGETIDAGQLRLLLQDSLAGDPDSATARQAGAVVLIRQRLAMKTLLELGGDALRAILDREWKAAEDAAAASGRTLDSIAAARGVSLEAYRQHLRWQIAWREYLKSRMTDAALQAFYQAYAARYGGRQYRISQVFLPSSESMPESQLRELADSLKQQSDRESAFARAAREISRAPSAASGGDNGWVSRDGDLPHQVMQAIRAAHSGDIVGPIASAFGYHLVLVREVRDTDQPFTALEDQTQLRKDFGDALFAGLVRKQQTATIRYLDPSLQWTPEGDPTVSAKKEASEALGQNTSDADR